MLSQEPSRSESNVEYVLGRYSEQLASYPAPTLNTYLRTATSWVHCCKSEATLYARSCLTKGRGSVCRTKPGTHVQKQRVVSKTLVLRLTQSDTVTGLADHLRPRTRRVHVTAKGKPVSVT